MRLNNLINNLQYIHIVEMLLRLGNKVDRCGHIMHRINAMVFYDTHLLHTHTVHMNIPFAYCVDSNPAGDFFYQRGLTKILGWISNHTESFKINH